VAAKKRLHHNVLAIALANKLARIAEAVLNKDPSIQSALFPSWVVIHLWNAFEGFDASGQNE
jgi:hypothetical protein